jgi:hypothetical protein
MLVPDFAGDPGCLHDAELQQNLSRFKGYQSAFVS